MRNPALHSEGPTLLHRVNRPLQSHKSEIAKRIKTAYKLSNGSIEKA